MGLFGNKQKENLKDKKSIVIYFSRADENYSVGYIEKGNTEVVAEFISDLTGADLFKVERKVPYAKDYMTCIREAQREQENDERPELVRELDNIDEYDVVFVGTPIYWGTMPQPMFTQLEKLNFEGKIVKPFTTHEGSGLGSVVQDLKRICKGADVQNGLAIRGASVQSSKSKVEEWI
ncbi:MAG: NAD(P)H-dependent oxidoreductase [Clostridia bacterium]|nr:NAD(P)H-dependent oxidoreductase [Clostridia bacterium]